jgi:hypothetical protein
MQVRLLLGTQKIVFYLFYSKFCGIIKQERLKNLCSLTTKSRSFLKKKQVQNQFQNTFFKDPSSLNKDGEKGAEDEQGKQKRQETDFGG